MRFFVNTFNRIRDIQLYSLVGAHPWLYSRFPSIQFSDMSDLTNLLDSLPRS